MSARDDAEQELAYVVGKTRAAEMLDSYRAEVLRDGAPAVDTAVSLIDSMLREEKRVLSERLGDANDTLAELRAELGRANNALALARSCAKILKDELDTAMGRGQVLSDTIERVRQQRDELQATNGRIWAELGRANNALALARIAASDLACPYGCCCAILPILDGDAR